MIVFLPFFHKRLNKNPKKIVKQLLINIKTGNDFRFLSFNFKKNFKGILINNNCFNCGKCYLISFDMTLSQCGIINMSGRKKVKANERQLKQQTQSNAQQQQQQQRSQKFKLIYEKMKQASRNHEQHKFGAILNAHRSMKHPILPVLLPQGDVYKSSTDKKKKPIEIYLDTVNTIYRKKDLDILINPIYVPSVFQKWAPLEIATFEESILKFGKQFEFISQLIGTKSTKDVYEFYLEWKGTSHFRSYKAAVLSANRANYEEWI